MEREYRVVWEIDVCAETPEGAAEEALRWHTENTDGTRWCWTVTDPETGVSVEVDLDDAYQCVDPKCPAAMPYHEHGKRRDGDGEG